MREKTVRIRFLRHCLGDVRGKDREGRILLPRSPNNHVVFLPTWHASNMRMAAQVVGRYQKAVSQIQWEMEIGCALKRDRWYSRYYNKGGRQRYAVHEAICPGQEVEINCVVPEEISDDGLLELMGVAGRYRGISPYRPGEFGMFQVERISARRPLSEEDSMAP